MNKQVAGEWKNRVIAEYASASILSELLHWLIRMGISPDLLYKCHSAVLDEIRHSEICREIFLRAGGSEEQIEIHPNSLTISHKPNAPLIVRAIHFTADFLCCGETIAGELFTKMHEYAEEPKAKATIASILKDELKHGELGWEILEELLQTLPEMNPKQSLGLKSEFIGYTDSYLIEPEQAIFFTREEKSWGILDSSEFFAIRKQCVASTLIPRFEKLLTAP